MSKLESGKIKLSPNQKSLIKFKKNLFNKKPVVNITSLDNRSFTLEYVNKDHFLISNNTDENSVLFYTATQTSILDTKNLVVTPVSLFLNTTNYSTSIDTLDFNQTIVDLDLNSFVETNEGNTLIFELVNQQEIISFESIFVDENGNLSFNSETFSSIYNSLNFDVLVTLQEDTSITKTINLNFDFISQTPPLYTTTLNSYINYLSSSSLTSYRQHNITYLSQSSSESSAVFITPQLSVNNEENYFVINADITLSPNLDLYIANSVELIYNTTDPENPTLNRTLKGPIYNFNYGFKLEDQKSYYFWYSSNDSCWYYNEDRFPYA